MNRTKHYNLKNHTMDDKKMRESWRGIMPSAKNEGLDPSILSSRRTALDRLGERYRRFYTIGFVFCLVSWVYYGSQIFPEGMRLGLCASLSAYFLLVACMDLWLYQGVKTIDVFRMNVREVASKAIFYKKRHHQFMLVLIPLAITLLVLIGMAFSDNEYALWGAGVGFLAGIALGASEYLKFMADYRSLTSDD